MNIVSVNYTDIMNYPGHVCATVYTAGCNYKCPWCHNWKLNKETNYIDITEITAELKKRKEFIDSVCITGGEPTIQNDLPQFCDYLKDEGFLVKLDTNGSKSFTVRSLLEYVDYVALDIKASPQSYEGVTRIFVRSDWDTDTWIPPYQTLEILKKQTHVKYEIRTTVLPTLSKHDFQIMSRYFDGVETYYLQQFDPSNCELWSKYISYSDNAIREFGSFFEGKVKNLKYRGLST